MAASVGRACAKVILLGEHAVVYGQPALVAGLERGVQARVTPATRSEHELCLRSAGSAGQRTASIRELEALAALANVFRVQQPLRVEVAFEVPEGVGLGASASAGVAIARALAQWSEQSATSDQLFEAAQAWESVFHGNASGVDAAAALHGGLLRYCRGQTPSAVTFAIPLHLVVAMAAPASSTRTMVEGVATLRERDTAAFDAWMSQIGSCVRSAERALGAGDGLALGKCMAENQELLRQLGVCTDELSAACQIALDAGAWGAKLTGAGGGGCVVALVPPGIESAVATALSKAGIASITTIVQPSLLSC